jgi:ABC-type branched-subunit amino acid transport system substrate-binding protein
MLAEGAEITIPGQDVDTVVTEFGSARLRGLTVKDRMKALIQIAHPDFRDWIEEEATRLKIVPKLTVTGFTPPKPRSGSPGPGVNGTTIRLGTLTDLSGPQASIGLAALRGISAYYQHVNHWGGIHGRKVELIVEDHAFDPGRASRSVDKLLAGESVFAIVSPLGTAPNLAVMDQLLEENIPVISPHSGISLWGNPLKPNYFALQPSYDIEGAIMAQYVLESQPETKIGLLAAEDQYGQEVSAAFVQEMKNQGEKPALILTHATGESDPAAWVEAFTRAGVDLVVIHSYVKPAADLLRAAQAADYYPSWLGSYVISGADLLELAGSKAVQGLRTTCYPVGPRAHRGERLFLKQMRRLYPGDSVSSHSRIGYAASQLVTEGLKRTGPDLTRDGFISALEGIQDWCGGLLPPISYSPQDHRGLTGLALQRAIGGRWILERNLLKLKE